MATISKKQKLSKRDSLDISGLYTPKIMYLPPNNYVSQGIETEEQGEYIDEEYLIQPEELNDGNDQIDADNTDDIEFIEDVDRRHEEHNAAVCCNYCRQERRSFEIVMLRKVNELLEIMRANPVERGRRPHYQLLPPMPFKDINSLIQFDRDLIENKEMQDQFIHKIQEIGGKTVQKTVKYAMEAVITDHLTKKVVWTLGPEKIPKISTFKFPYLIIDVVRNAFPETKIKILEDRIADWLRRGVTE